jgi:hypothetical protein
VCARRPVHVRLEQLAFEIHPRARPPGCLEVAPRALRRGLRRARRPVPLGRFELGLHIHQIPLGQGELFPLRLELPLQHRHPFPVSRGKAVGDLHGLVVLNLARQPPPSLCVGEVLAFRGELRLGPRQRLAHLPDRHRGIHDRLAHLTRQVAQVSDGRRRFQSGPQRIPQTLEHVCQLFRIVLAKKVENTDSTAFDPHLGQAGCRRPCALIGMASLKRFRHFVQRYS